MERRGNCFPLLPFFSCHRLGGWAEARRSLSWPTRGPRKVLLCGVSLTVRVHHARPAAAAEAEAAEAAEPLPPAAEAAAAPRPAAAAAEPRDRPAAGRT